MLSEPVQFDAERVKRFQELGLWTDDRFDDWLARHASERPDSIALEGIDDSYTYAQLWAAVQRAATGLLDIGLRKGDVVALQLANTAEFLIAYFAIQRIGGIVSTLHLNYRMGEIVPQLRHVPARAVICETANDKFDAPQAFLELADKDPHLEFVIVNSEQSPAGTIPLRRILDATAAPIVDPPTAADPYLVLFTSGTSAAPKAVVHTSQTLLSNARLAIPRLGLRPTDVVMGASAFTHGLGLCICHLALYVGCKNVLLPTYKPDAYLKRIEDGRVTLLMTTPAHWASAANAERLENYDLTSLRTMIFSGAYCPPEIAEEAEAATRGGRFIPLWGMTECMIGLLGDPADSLAVRHRSVGKAMPGFEIRSIAPDTGAEASIGQVGELIIRGSTVFRSYYRNDNANAAAFTPDGWFRTGDLGYVDEDGNLFLSGRAKDLINRGGVKINPADVESVLHTHPSILQCAVAPVPDRVFGERACLYVTLRPQCAFTLEEASAHLARHGIAKLKWPEKLVILDEMPMNPARKIVKGELAAYAARKGHATE